MPDLDPRRIPSPHSRSELERFCQLVLEDTVLQEELHALTDQRQFVERVLRVGAARGCRFSAADVEEALRDARRAWLERWIV